MTVILIICRSQFFAMHVDQISKLHHKFSSSGWVLDKNNIFAHVDAFIQRCKDLLDVCDAQQHFARYEDGLKLEMPHFGGQNGPEIYRSLLEIEKQFDKNMNILRTVKETILDVKVTSWHDDYNRLLTFVNYFLTSIC